MEFFSVYFLKDALAIGGKMMSNKHQGGSHGGANNYGAPRHSKNPLDINHDGKVDYKGLL